MSDVLKEYLRWLIPMALFSYIAILFLPIKAIGAIALVAIFMVPVDRVRVSMLKKQVSIPPKRTAMKYIGLFSIAPTILGFYVGFNSEVPDGMYRANVVVSSLIMLPGVPLVFFCIQFLASSTWSKGLKKYAGS